jgi:hypothetical protein
VHPGGLLSRVFGSSPKTLATAADQKGTGSSMAALSSEEFETRLKEIETNLLKKIESMIIQTKDNHVQEPSPPMTRSRSEKKETPVMHVSGNIKMLGKVGSELERSKSRSPSIAQSKSKTSSKAILVKESREKLIEDKGKAAEPKFLSPASEERSPKVEPLKFQANENNMQVSDLLMRTNM